MQYRLRGTRQNSAKSTFVGCPEGVLTWDGGPMPSPLHSSMTEIIFSAQFLRSFHSIPFHSIPFHSILFHSISFHFIHVNPHLNNVFYTRLNHPLTVSQAAWPHLQRGRGTRTSAPPNGAEQRLRWNQFRSLRKSKKNPPFWIEDISMRKKSMLLCMPSFVAWHDSDSEFQDLWGSAKQEVMISGHRLPDHSEVSIRLGAHHLQLVVP